MIVWCTIWAGGIISLSFFEDEEGDTVTVNRDRYHSMSYERLWPILENMDIDKIILYNKMVLLKQMLFHMTNSLTVQIYLTTQ